MKKTLLLAWLIFAAGAGAGEALFPDDYSDLKDWKIFYPPKTGLSRSEGPGGIPALKISSPGFAGKMYKFDWNNRKEWDRKYNGVSFWVRGDGSDHWGCLGVGMNWGWGYTWYFPLKDRNWKKYTVAWSDFMPQSGANSKLIGTDSAPTVSSLALLRIGDRWIYTHNNALLPKYSYEIADIQLISDAKPELEIGKYQSLPINDFRKKINGKEDVSILCLGDSITAGTSLADKEAERYAVQLDRLLKARCKRDNIRAFSRGVGGAALYDTLNWMNRDLDGVAPDMITLMIGYNNISGGVQAESFRKQLELWIDRVIAKTKGKAAILLVPTIPGRDFRFDMHDDYARVVREVARERGLSVCPVDQVFKKMGNEKFAKLMADTAHPNAEGHRVFAAALADFILSEK